MLKTRILTVYSRNRYPLKFGIEVGIQMEEIVHHRDATRLSVK